MDIGKAAQVFVFLINVAFSAWFIAYLTALEKKGCKCALTWHRKAMIALIMISLVVAFGTLFTEQNSTLRTVSGVVMAPINIAYIVISLIYIMQLKKENCECSKDPARTTIEVFAWIAVAFACLALLLSVLSMFIERSKK